MKYLIIQITTFLLGIAITNAQNPQVQEVYIIGTMHTVPKIVKHSYKPMLKDALNYNPESIYVESPRANDTLSWEYLKNGWSDAYKKFYFLSDSIKRSFTPSQDKIYQILNKEFKAMTDSDLEYLIESFAYHRDYANYEFYSYIKTYGNEGSKRPTRNEDGDLTFKLALKQNIKQLKSMDDQRFNDLYHQAWRQCGKEGRENGNNALNAKLNKKHYNAAILSAILGRLGKRTNTRKSLEMLHKMSSFTYTQIDTPGCLEGKKYWTKRNNGMSKNIGEQVLASGLSKNIVIVGASHVLELEKELKDNYPELKIILMDN